MQDLEIVETRKLASFRLVDSIEPIEGADAIELAVVGGWKVVTKKGEFNPGDTCIYFEIDSFLPDGVPAWQFLVDKSARIFNGIKGHRLRTIKLRGQISQGLILSVPAFPAAEAVFLLCTDNTYVFNSEKYTENEIKLVSKYYADAYNSLHNDNCSPYDLSLNELLGIVKWDPPLSPQLAGQAKGLFPSFIRKTDQERAQNLKEEIFQFEDVIIPANEELNRPEIIRAAKGNPNALYEVSLKLDGSSMTVFAKNVDNTVVTGVCSRNLELHISEANAENSFVKKATESQLLHVLEKICTERNVQLAVQGELMGPGIQNNREGHAAFEFYVFDIFDIGAGVYLAPEDRISVFNDLVKKGANIKHVPIIADNASLQSLDIHDMSALLKFAEGPSIKHPVREGLVYKRMDGKFNFKTISNVYLAKEKD